tara:strand:- start:586 stop:2370 length:1785 start_codon:yes stop_codon:yes gene_type:complete
MARQAINIGSSANDGTGDPLRTAFDKINDNFVELYGTDNDINTLDANLDVRTHAITTGVTNGNITVTPNGTGSINLGSITINGSQVSSNDSTQITLADNIQTTGTLDVSGATALASTLTVGTSLALATGATVTGIDNGSLGSSATLLATQGAIKTYVDAQVTAQDLDFACDDSTTLSIDLDSESLQFSGGTGITTAGTLNTVTIAIDGTVATLTGSQTLTNKILTTPTINGATMTGNVTVDNITLNDNIISSSSNADLILDPAGTGDIKLNATSVDVTGNASVSGTLSTADITTTGNTTVSGNTSVAGTLTVQGSVIADTIVSNSNGDITIDPAGTGAIKLTGPITATGTQTTTGQLNIDNLRLDGNTVSSTSGGITLSPLAGQNLVLGPTSGGIVTAPELQATLGEFTTLRADALQNDTSDGNLAISTQGTGAVTVASQLTLSGSFKKAIHTITATDAITEIEHAGRTLLLGEVGGNANVVLTLPDATGSGNIYHFIVSVAMGGSTTYKIQVPDADNTITGQIMYLDEDGTAVTSFPTVAASDTITLNSGTQGGLVGDTLTLIDIAADKYAVSGHMRVAAGADPATPFTAAVS